MKKIPYLLIIILILAAALRLYKIGDIPMGVFGDEIDAGYNAYSFLKTGRDYNGNLFPIHFQSMGDYRPFLFILSLVPSIAIFGLSEFSVRLVPALWGILGVYLIYLLSNLTVKNNLHKFGIWHLEFGILPALLLAITPWHIHYSRAAFEVTLTVSLLLLGTYTLIKSQTKPSLLILSAFIFGINAYSYNVAKLYSPLLFLIAIFIYRKTLFSHSKRLIFTSFFLFILILTPLIYDSTLGHGQNRFNSISLLNDSKLVEEINYSRGQIPNFPEPIKRIFHNKLVSTATTFTQQYFQSLSPQFLFSTGDLHNPRHSLPNFGLLYFWLAPFTLLGLYFAWHQRQQPLIQLILAWLFTAPIPASLTLEGGQHATRLFIILPPLIIITGLGISHSYEIFKKYSHLLTISFISLAAISLVFYLQNYYYHYSPTYYHWWNYGFRPALQFAQQHESQYDTIIITRSHSHLPMLYYLFYTKYDPSQLHQQFQTDNPPPTDQIGKYHFRTINKEEIYTEASTLYIASHWEDSHSWRQIGQLNSPDPQNTNPVFVYLESNTKI